MEFKNWKLEDKSGTLTVEGRTSTHKSKKTISLFSYRVLVPIEGKPKSQCSVLSLDREEAKLLVQSLNEFIESAV